MGASHGGGCRRLVVGVVARAVGGVDAGTEYSDEACPQGGIRLVHADRQPQVDKAGDAVPPDAAGHDAGEMAQIRLDVEADAVERHPATDADADGCDLVLGAVALVRPAHPDADAVLALLAAQVEGGQRADDPALPAPPRRP